MRAHTSFTFYSNIYIYIHVHMYVLYTVQVLLFSRYMYTGAPTYIFKNLIFFFNKARFSTNIHTLYVHTVYMYYPCFVMYAGCAHTPVLPVK